jgi:hypothetical protein
MMLEELGLLGASENPFKDSLAIFLSFCLFWFIPSKNYWIITKLSHSLLWSSLFKERVICSSYSYDRSLHAAAWSGEGAFYMLEMVLVGIGNVDRGSICSINILLNWNGVRSGKNLNMCSQ